MKMLMIGMCMAWMAYTFSMETKESTECCLYVQVSSRGGIIEVGRTKMSKRCGLVKTLSYQHKDRREETGPASSAFTNSLMNLTSPFPPPPLP